MGLWRDPFVHFRVLVIGELNKVLNYLSSYAAQKNASQKPSLSYLQANPSSLIHRSKEDL